MNRAQKALLVFAHTENFHMFWLFSLVRDRRSRFLHFNPKSLLCNEYELLTTEYGVHGWWRFSGCESLTIWGIEISHRSKIQIELQSPPKEEHLKICKGSKINCYDTQEISQGLSRLPSVLIKMSLQSETWSQFQACPQSETSQNCQRKARDAQGTQTVLNLKCNHWVGVCELEQQRH